MQVKESAWHSKTCRSSFLLMQKTWKRKVKVFDWQLSSIFNDRNIWLTKAQERVSCSLACFFLLAKTCGQATNCCKPTLRGSHFPPCSLLEWLSRSTSSSAWLWVWNKTKDMTVHARGDSGATLNGQLSSWPRAKSERKGTSPWFEGLVQPRRLH